MRYVSSLITVKNMELSRYFYETLLSQKVMADYGENLAFEGGFSLHDRGHFEGLTGLHGSEERPDRFELYFETDTPEEAEAMLKSARVEFIHSLKEQPWRQKVLRCYDPDGTIVEIGESMKTLTARLFGEGMTLEAIAEKFKLPLESVKRASGQ